MHVVFFKLEVHVVFFRLEVPCSAVEHHLSSATTVESMIEVVQAR